MVPAMCSKALHDGDRISPIIVAESSLQHVGHYLAFFQRAQPRCTWRFFEILCFVSRQQKLNDINLLLVMRSESRISSIHPGALDLVDIKWIALGQKV